MGLCMGKTIDRCYDLRLPFLNGYYDIGVFFNKRSPLVLFKVDPDFPSSDISGFKINMFKNLTTSRFCETFINLHNFRKSTLDILNQFKEIKPEYNTYVNFILNETISLTKIEVDDKVFYDTLNIYGLTITSYSNEFIFLMAERHNIVKRLSKKVVRTTGLQIATSSSLSALNDFYEESKLCGKEGPDSLFGSPDDVIKLN